MSGRLALAIEVLRTYALARRLLATRPIADAVDELRAPAVPRLPAEPGTPRRLSRATTLVVGRLPGENRCLIRSLVLLRLLARRDLEAILVLSAASDGDGLDAHAHIEHGGRPLLPPGGEGHATLARL